MKILLLSFVLLFLTACGGGGSGPISEAKADTVPLGTTWMDESGRVNQQTSVDYASTAYTMWPTRGTQPTTDSFSELTLYRTNYLSMPNFERLNVSAMVNADGGAYRIGVERGGTGEFKPIIFCFENVTPGVAICPMQVTLAGIFVNVNGQWRAVAYQ